jgi:hypothetical protein
MVRFLCERLAAALRACVMANCAAIDSARWREQRPPTIQTGISDRVSSRTWQMVNSGFFPPMGQPKLRQKQMTDARQDQVTHNRGILAHLEMVHTQFRLAILEQPLDPPSAEGYQQKNLGRRRLWRVAQEKLDFIWLRKGAEITSGFLGARQ